MGSSPELAQLETQLAASFEIEPVETFVHLERTDCRVRLLDVGDGPAIVFLHGTMTAGACWLDLAARFPDFRCILLDRPGCELQHTPIGSTDRRDGLPSRSADRQDTDLHAVSDAPRPAGMRGPHDEVVHTPELLARVSAPTLLFCGDDDPFGGVEVAERFAGQLPDAVLDIVIGAGHVPWIDRLGGAAGSMRRHLTM